MIRIAGLALCAALLSGCGSGGPQPGTRLPGTDPAGAAVDGLTVGHRLAAAGEHELALRAYLRAAAERGADVDVLSAIGSTNLQLGRLGQSEQILRRALEIEPDFVPALNNLGVVLMEKGETGEAMRLFQRAFALDSGNSDDIRENLRLAIAKSTKPGYAADNDNNTFSLVRRGAGQYLLLSNR